MPKRLILACLLSSSIAAFAQRTTWRFDSLATIGNQTQTTVGTPKLITTDLGKAIHFDGHGNTGDALYFDTIPLTGTLPYTREVIFRPSSAGAPEQRFFHLQEDGTQTRRLFEIRIVDKQWCLDAFAGTSTSADPAHTAVILKCDTAHLFPLDHWYAVAAVYDGKILRSYVNGVLQGEAPVALTPLGKGGVSVGTRYNKRDFFTGDIHTARFTPSALAVPDLLKLPTIPLSPVRENNLTGPL